MGKTQAPGAEAEITAIYRATLGHVYGYLMLLTGGQRSLSDDLVAEVYLHATRHVAAGKGNEVTIGWLKTVAKRRFIDHLRRESAMARRAEKLQSIVRAETRDRQNGRLEEIHTDVYAALDRLPPEQRLVIVMRHLDGASLAEIAAPLGRSVKATESLLGRARQAFRAAFEEVSDG